MRGLVTGTVTLLITAVLLTGCYSSRITLDGTSDFGVDLRRDAESEPHPDPVPDPGYDPRADWDSPDGFAAAPEKPVLTSAVSSAHPSIAFTGTDVGLVYRSLAATGNWSIAFIPLDAEGAVTGSERTLTGRGAAVDSIPRISSAGDGDFLVCALFSSERALFLARVQPGGEVAASSETEYEGGLYNPLSAPVRLGDDVYVLAEVSSSAGQVALFRFSYPSMTFESVSRMTSWDGMGIVPVLMSDPGRRVLVVNSRHSSGMHAAIEDVSISEMYYTGAITTFGGDRYGNFVTALHASSSITTWFAYTVIWDSESWRWQFFRFDPIGDHEDHEPFWYGPETNGEAVGEIMDSDTTDHPYSAAAFSVIMDGQWQVWVHVIDGAGYRAPTGLFPVGLGTSTRPEIPPHPTVAWTGDGFLVVWDKPVLLDLSGSTLASAYVEID